MFLLVLVLECCGKIMKGENGRVNNGSNVIDLEGTNHLSELSSIADFNPANHLLYMCKDSAFAAGFDYTTSGTTSVLEFLGLHTAQSLFLRTRDHYLTTSSKSS